MPKRAGRYPQLRYVTVASYIFLTMFKPSIAPSWLTPHLFGLLAFQGGIERYSKEIHTFIVFVLRTHPAFLDAFKSTAATTESSTSAAGLLNFLTAALLKNGTAAFSVHFSIIETPDTCHQTHITVQHIQTSWLGAS